MEWWKVALGLFGFFLLIGILALVGTKVASGSCVSVLRLSGEITLDEPSLFSNAPSAHTLTKKIREWQESSSPVLLLEINSPGGGAVASKELYDTLRASKKPVVSYLEEVAASGGYYAAAATSYIVANPNTLTGSIGARAEFLNYEQLFQKIGLRQDSVQSGKLKDIGAPYRNMTVEERVVFQQIIAELYQNFKTDVEEGRKGKLTQAFSQASDARVLSAKQALSAGLVDEIGGKSAALKKAAALGGLGDSEKPTECQLDQESPLDSAFSKFGTGFAQGLFSLLQRNSVRFSYT